MQIKHWVKLYISVPIILIFIVFTFNFIIDPYSITSFNLLKIPNKFARDDRKEKVAKLFKEERYDNLLLGSSRVYSINPLLLKKYIHGRTYNSGVGGALIEDQLGFLLYLERLKKLPKYILFGLDFGSFNKNLETNKYFILNDELNFINKKSSNNDIYFSRFLSIDATRASYKTLANFIKDSTSKPRFDSNGAANNASKNFTYYPSIIKKTKFKEKKVKEAFDAIKTSNYRVISKKRLLYLEKIISICKKNNIKYTFFLTPLNSQLISKIQKDKEVGKTFIQFKTIISSITEYYDFIRYNTINDNRFNFGDPKHPNIYTGNLILARLFNDKNVSLPENFGVLIPKNSKFINIDEFTNSKL